MKPRVRTTRSEPQAVRAAWSIALPVAITLLGFGLRLYRIDHQSIWWDEAHSIFVARGGLRAVWDLPHTVSYNHPPLHYALLVGWVRLAGVSELAVRAPSLLFGTLLLPATYLLIRRLLNRRAALAAMLVVTLAPVYVYFSQEARVYALLPLLYVLMLAVLHRIFQQGRAAPARLWVALAALEAAALFAHYFMVLAVITVNLLLAAWWLRTRDVPVRRWALSQGAAVAPFALWALRLTASIELLQADLAVTAGIADPVRSVWRIVRFLLGGQAAHVSSDERLLTAVGVLAALIVLGLLALAAGSGRRSPVWWLVLATLVPLALALPVYILVPQTQPRYLLAFSAPLFAAVGAAVAELLAG
ncbi:MAG: glycosyltransferase family 39 protein, partial [Aggregatilineales bacterium]